MAPRSFSTHSENERNPYGRSYKWPDSLYDELKEMSSICQLAKQMGLLSSLCRKANETHDIVNGLKYERRNALTLKKWGEKALSLRYNFSPKEVKQLIVDNFPTLQKYFSGFTGEDFSQIVMSLDELEEVKVSRDPSSHQSLSELSAKSNGSISKSFGWRPFTIQEFENNFQPDEEIGLVYSIVKDAYHKRVTLVFRETDSFYTYTMKTLIENLSAPITEVPLPDAIKAKIGDDADDKIGLHERYYEYLFSRNTDGSTTYDRIKKDVSAILKNSRGYMLYVTGQSVAAALSTIAAFYLSCERDLPKPITCINFASPRVGSRSFLNASQFLERTCKLKIVRVVSDDDPIAAIPMGRDYAHVGFQVSLHKDNSCSSGIPPDLHYPNLTLEWQDWLKISWRNSILTSLTASFGCHKNYREILNPPATRSFLEKYDLVGMYKNEDLVGYELMCLGVKFAIGV